MCIASTNYVSARYVAPMAGRAVSSLQSVGVDHAASDTHNFEGFAIRGSLRSWGENAVFEC